MSNNAGELPVIQNQIDFNKKVSHFLKHQYKYAECHNFTLRLVALTLQSLVDDQFLFSNKYSDEILEKYYTKSLSDLDKQFAKTARHIFSKSLIPKVYH